MPYGGAGPLHACQLAEALQIKKILVPRHPGALSALGALISETRFDYRQTLRMLSSTLDIGKAVKVYSDLERKAAEDFDKEGFATAPLLERTIELRYYGQNFELEVPVTPGILDKAAFEQIVVDFHAEHDRIYGYTLPAQEIEFLNLNVAASAKHTAIELPKLDKLMSKVEPTGTAAVILPGGYEPELVPLYDRETFGVGAVLKGPAIIGQMDTTLLAQNAIATVDKWGNMLIELDGEKMSNSMALKKDIEQVVETDPFVLEIIRNYLTTTCEEMGTTMMRTSFSPIFNEARDFIVVSTTPRWSYWRKLIMCLLCWVQPGMELS